MSRYQSCSPGMKTFLIFTSFSSSAPSCSSTGSPSCARSPPKIRKSAGGFIACTSLKARTVFSTKRVLTSFGYRWVSETQAKRKLWPGLGVGHVQRVDQREEAVGRGTGRALAAATRAGRCGGSTTVPRSGRSPAARSVRCISRRSSSWAFIWLSSSLGVEGTGWSREPASSLLLLQLDRELGGLAALDRDRRSRCRRCSTATPPACSCRAARR